MMLPAVTGFGVIGKSTYDARLVAEMAVHGIDRILTFNRQDFQRYPGIAVVTPAQLL